MGAFIQSKVLTRRIQWPTSSTPERSGSSMLGYRTFPSSWNWTNASSRRHYNSVQNFSVESESTDHISGLPEWKAYSIAGSFWLTVQMHCWVRVSWIESKRTVSARPTKTLVLPFDPSSKRYSMLVAQCAQHPHKAVVIAPQRVPKSRPSRFPAKCHPVERAGRGFVTLHPPSSGRTG